MLIFYRIFVIVLVGEIILTKKLKIVLCVLLGLLVLLSATLVILYYTTQTSIEKYIKLPTYVLSEQYATNVDSSQDYLGQPDMVLTSTGKLITVYPQGHGHGSLVMKTSSDGLIWENQICPSSWAKSQEVPTLYTLNRTDGKQYIILISGKPYWVADNLRADGFQYSISKDDGNSWSEFTTVHSPMDCIVAMSSLTQLKENGEYVDKWMGTFHTHNFVNYKTILTFDENDNAVWSTPEPILGDYRKIEKRNKLCELEIIRDKNDTLIMLARNEARGEKTSMICFSIDEGNTWSEPQYLPIDLSGDRFQAVYDNKNDKVLISFRQIVPYKPNALSFTKFMTYGWVLWIGTFDDLINADENSVGGKLIILGQDTSGDCGYSGIVVNNGFITAVSYGHFLSPQKSNILAVNFNLSEIDTFTKILN